MVRCNQTNSSHGLVALKVRRPVIPKFNSNVRIDPTRACLRRARSQASTPVTTQRTFHALKPGARLSGSSPAKDLPYQLTAPATKWGHIIRAPEFYDLIHRGLSHFREIGI